MDIYRFSGYVLDAKRRELKHSGEPVEVQPRVFDLLLYLVERRERVVSKDELQDAVWPGLILTETALTRAVMKARKAIGDDAQAQSLIRTVHGHGYHFVGSIDDEPVPDSIEPESSQPVTTPTEPLQTPAAAPGATPAPSSEPVNERNPFARWRWTLPLTLALITLILLVFVPPWSDWLKAPGPMEADDIQEKDSQPMLAVLPLVNRTGDAELDWTRLGFMSLASGMLSAGGELATVADGSMVTLVDTLGWSGDLEDPANSELLTRLRESLGSSHQLAMELSREGSMFRMNYTLLNPAGRIRKGTMVGNDAPELAKGVVQAVYGILLQKSRMGEGIDPVSADPFNNEAFARGMSFSLQGRCKEAVPFFRLVADQEHSLFAPRYELAYCLRILGEVAETEQILDELVAEQTSLGPSRHLARALMLQGILYNRTGRLEQADEVYGEALEIAQGLAEPDHQLTARILHNQAILAEDRNDWAGSLTLLDRATLEYREGGLEVLPGQLYSAYANLKMDQGELAEAETYLDQAIAAFRQLGDRRNEAMMLNNTGYLRRQQGRWDEAETFHLQSLAIREDIGDRVGMGRVYSMLGVVHQAKGELEEARNSIEAGLRIARETEDTLFAGTSLAQLGDVMLALGERDAARTHYQEGRDVFASIDDEMRVLQSELKLARMDLEEDKLDRARATAESVLQASVQNDLMQPEIQATELLAETEHAAGDVKAARHYFEQALERVRASSWSAKEADILCKLSDLLLDMQEHQAAEPLLGALSRLEPSLCAASVRARYAFEQGDSASAVELMESAKKQFSARWSEVNESELNRYSSATGGNF